MKKLHRPIPNYTPSNSWYDNLKSLWVNARSLIYAGLTISGILIVVFGSLLLLPLVIILVLGVAIFTAYKMGSTDYKN